MITKLEQICMAFYQERTKIAYEAFQQILPALLQTLENKVGTESLVLVNQMLDCAQVSDWVMMADIINFELIPLLSDLEEQG